MSLNHHIVVLGWAPNYLDFVLPLRSKRHHNYRPIVFVTPCKPPEDQLASLVHLPHVHVIVSEVERSFQKVRLPDPNCTP